MLLEVSSLTTAYAGMVAIADVSLTVEQGEIVVVAGANGAGKSTLLQSIAGKYGNLPMQIVGATATIEGYESQVDHLYKRTARRFPANGPNVGETFWSTTSAVTLASSPEPLSLVARPKPCQALQPSPPHLTPTKQTEIFNKKVCVVTPPTQLN